MLHDDGLALLLSLAFVLALFASHVEEDRPALQEFRSSTKLTLKAQVRRPGSDGVPSRGLRGPRGRGRARARRRVRHLLPEVEVRHGIAFDDLHMHSQPACAYVLKAAVVVVRGEGHGQGPLVRVARHHDALAPGLRLTLFFATFERVVPDFLARDKFCTMTGIAIPPRMVDPHQVGCRSCGGHRVSSDVPLLVGTLGAAAPHVDGASPGGPRGRVKAEAEAAADLPLLLVVGPLLVPVAAHASPHVHLPLVHGPRRRVEAEAVAILDLACPRVVCPLQAVLAAGLHAQRRPLLGLPGDLQTETVDVPDLADNFF
mmetsp:Transcript_46907/g.135642  ORF Transcript_46907/g.135642 Transcript_46907/m.135642 type:complete len:315 (-) Transcript_46907:338-1282(-)